MSKFLSKKYKGLTPYTPGEQPRDNVFIKLNTNESPFPPSPKAIKAAVAAAEKVNLYSDPACTDLIKSVAAAFEVPENCIVCSNGSDEVLSPHIDAKDLIVDDKVKVSWRPDRRCTFRYLGDLQFEVEAAENSKLKVGNTFYCSLFILGEPLYISRLVQGKNPPVDFVVGNKDGLCELEKV